MEPVASQNIPLFQFRFLFYMIVSLSRIENFLAHQEKKRYSKSQFFFLLYSLWISYEVNLRVAERCMKDLSLSD